MKLTSFPRILGILCLFAPYSMLRLYPFDVVDWMFFIVILGLCTLLIFFDELESWFVSEDEVVPK